MQGVIQLLLNIFHSLCVAMIKKTDKYKVEIIHFGKKYF